MNCCFSETCFYTDKCLSSVTSERLFTQPYSCTVKKQKDQIKGDDRRAELSHHRLNVIYVCDVMCMQCIRACVCIYLFFPAETGGNFQVRLDEEFYRIAGAAYDDGAQWKQSRSGNV